MGGELGARVPVADVGRSFVELSSERGVGREMPDEVSEPADAGRYGVAGAEEGFSEVCAVVPPEVGLDGGVVVPEEAAEAGDSPRVTP